MAANRRVPMSAVRYINFHSDAVTLSRRGSTIREYESGGRVSVSVSLCVYTCSRRKARAVRMQARARDLQCGAPVLRLRRIH